VESCTLTLMQQVGSTGIFSVGNTIGRLLVGFLSDQFLHRVSRAFFLVVPCAVMLLAQLWMAFASVDMVYAVAAVQGLAHGGLFCVFPMLVWYVLACSACQCSCRMCRVLIPMVAAVACTPCSHYFGLPHFGANWGMAGLAPAIGSEVLGAVMAPALFKKACGTSSGACFDNTAAFQYTLLINTGLCGIGVACAWWLKQRKLPVWRASQRGPHVEQLKTAV